MTKLPLRTTLLVIVLLIGSTTVAQKRSELLRTRIDSLLDKNYNKVNFDTAYIGRPKTNLTLKARASVAGSNLYIREKSNGERTKADLETSHTVKLSLGANYKGLAAAISLNPTRLSGKNNDFEFNLNYYSNRFCVEMGYQMSKTMAGDVSRGDKSGHLDRGSLKTKLLNITGYYVFNNKRFSFPAAFSQTYIQKLPGASSSSFPERIQSIAFCIRSHVSNRIQSRSLCHLLFSRIFRAISSSRPSRLSSSSRERTRLSACSSVKLSKGLRA